MTTQKIYRFDDITITKTRTEDSTGVYKHLDIEQNKGSHSEIISPNSPEAHEAIIKMINQENQG